MSRAARIKDPEGVYHVMSRSITEFDLFPDDSDKNAFLDILQKYKEKFQCKIYGYCLMSNHYHLHLDTCGFDISSFMKCLNQSHVRRINFKYNRRGHLLAERFNSKIVKTDQYNLTVSAYIHNNSKDLPGFAGKESDYPYSSLGIYLGKRKDRRDLIDTDFILGSVNEIDKGKAIKAYSEMVIEKRDMDTNINLRKYLEEFQKEQFEYKSHREIILRNKKPEEVIKYISQKFEISDSIELTHRWRRSTIRYRSVVAYALSVLCGMSYREICKYMNNITAAGCARLSQIGFEIIKNSGEVKGFMLALRAT